jgi:hypothetical protein
MPQHGQQVQQLDYSELMKKIISGLRTRIFEYLHTVPKEARMANDVQQLVDRINALSGGE